MPSQETSRAQNSTAPAQVTAALFRLRRGGICVIDVREPDLPVVYIDKGAERITHRSREALLGKAYNKVFVRNGDNPGAWELFAAIEERRACISDVDFQFEDGQRMTARISGRPVTTPEGTVSHYVIMIEDISELKNFEAAISDYLARQKFSSS